MQRKIWAVEKCVCYQGKRSFKGESSQMKKQILEVSGELRMLKLQVINLVGFFFFFIFGRPKQMTTIPFCTHRTELQLCQLWAPLLLGAAATPWMATTAPAHPPSPLASCTKLHMPGLYIFTNPTTAPTSAECSGILAGKPGKNSFLPVGKEGFCFCEQNTTLCVWIVW